ncbi:MAG: hypothetical protein M3O71_09945 [Bacteroidota bacterium]|nr:hypothetical protein [Bacteroidota bacterium]
MAYQVLTAENGTLITDEQSCLRVQITEKGRIALSENAAYCLGTLYKIKGGFVPERIFVFLSLAEISLEELKKTVDFFFSSLIETELYVKEVPQDSILYPEEAFRLYGKKEEELNDGTAGIISTGRTK